MVQVTASSPAWRLVLKGQKRDEKAEYDEPDVVIPSSKWLWLTQVKLCPKRRQAQPAYPGYQAGPKWDCILGDVVKSHVVTIPHRYRRKAATYGQ
jgi:hypothetical protein